MKNTITLFILLNSGLWASEDCFTTTNELISSSHRNVRIGLELSLLAHLGTYYALEQSEMDFGSLVDSGTTDEKPLAITIVAKKELPEVKEPVEVKSEPRPEVSRSEPIIPKPPEEKKEEPVDPVKEELPEETPEAGLDEEYEVQNQIGQTQEQRDNILSKVTRSLRKYFHYPRQARRRNMEGTVLVSFRINSKGQIYDIKLEKSSGYRVLDKSALNSLKKAVRKLSFPKNYHTDEKLSVPIVYYFK